MSERRVLELIAEGHTNAAIADVLVLSLRTVEAHVRAIFTKLDLPPDEGVHRRVAAALAWVESRTRLHAA